MLKTLSTAANKEILSCNHVAMCGAVTSGSHVPWLCCGFVVVSMETEHNFEQKRSIAGIA